MNFNKYHVSRNLCLVSQNNSIYYAALNKYSVNNNSVTVTGEALFGFICKALPNTNYTVSAYADTIGAQLRIREYSDVPTEWSTNFVNQPINKQLTTYSDASFTTGSSTNYFLVVFYTPPTTTHINIFNIMLNTGSEPLPYEPYSSEVWHDIPHYIHKTDTDTITTLPADIYANDTTATVGLKGNMSQTGTPTPQNPIMPQETGERTWNLFNPNGITTNERGETRTGVELPAGAYCITNLSNAAIYWRIGVETAPGNQINPSTPYVYINASDTLVVWVGATNNKIVMINTGSTPRPYENFGYKIPISSANITTPVYLGEIESTRRIKKLVLTGEETVTNTKETTTSGLYCFVYKLSDLGMTDIADYDEDMSQIEYPQFICTHFKSKAAPSTIPNDYYDISDGEIGANSLQDTMTYNRYLIVCASGHNNAASFKSYLAQQYAAGTPVTVWYVLATPETAVVNEPLRKIGEYADEVSNVSIPVTAGGDTISVDTTVQPSEVTVNYKGWHPAIVHERTNGAWT